MTQMSEKTYTGEWLKWLVNRDFCLDMTAITQDADATVGLVSGEFLDGGVGVTDGVGSTCDRILIEPVALADLISATPGNYLTLVRGPAIIDSDMCGLKTADNDMTDEKADALVALAALDIRVAQSDLTSYSTQTF